MSLFEELDELYPDNREIGEFHMDAQGVHKEKTEEEEDLISDPNNYYESNYEEDDECELPF